MKEYGFKFDAEEGTYTFTISARSPFCAVIEMNMFLWAHFPELSFHDVYDMWGDEEYE